MKTRDVVIALRILPKALMLEAAIIAILAVAVPLVAIAILMEKTEPGGGIDG
jgi:hypothetical protein